MWGASIHYQGSTSIQVEASHLSPYRGPQFHAVLREDRLSRRFPRGDNPAWLSSILLFPKIRHADLIADPSWAGQDPNNKNCRAPVLRSEDVLLAYSLLITVPRCSDRSRPKLDIRPVDGPGRRRHNHLAKLVSKETRKPLRPLGAAPGGPGAQSANQSSKRIQRPWIGSIPGAKVKIIRNKESKCALYEVPIPCQRRLSPTSACLAASASPDGGSSGQSALHLLAATRGCDMYGISPIPARFSVLGLYRSIHALDQASGTHVSPILVDVIEADLTGVMLVDADPAGRDFNKFGPERILTLIINQHDIAAVFVFEWIRHSHSLVCASSRQSLNCAAVVRECSRRYES